MIRDVLLRRSYRRDRPGPYGGVRSPLQLYLGPCRLLLPASDGKSLERPLLNHRPSKKSRTGPTDAASDLFGCLADWRFARYDAPNYSSFSSS